MNDPKVSVIVPVFNGASHVAGCIDSLLAQTLPDIEVIVIDDGSADGTGSICREYAERDNRVVVLHQENSGVSSARNAGLCVARGRYLAFADADDRMLADGIESLFRVAEQSAADIVIGGYLVGSGSSSKVVRPKEARPGLEVLLSFLNDENHSAFWNKLIKRSSLGDLRFPSDIRYAEDQVLLVEFLVAQKRAASFFLDPVYLHQQYHGSVTRSGGHSLLDLLDAKIRVGGLLVVYGMQDTTRAQFSEGASKAVLSVVRNIDGALLELARDRLVSYSQNLRRAGLYTGATGFSRILLAICRLPRPLSVHLLRLVRFAGSHSSALRWRRSKVLNA